MEKYVPPYGVTEEMLSLTAEIMELLGELKGISDIEKLPRLRRVNQIKSIHSSLAIENNTLTLKQVTDVIDGKRVLGPEDDILAVKNAYEAYKCIDDFNPYSITDLTKAHGIMMKGLVEEAGKIRTTSVGVIDQNGNVIHVAPPAQIVKGLISQLFDWARTSKTPMLIKSSIFHYEFEFIHPFLDGNGRMGRLWQTSMLKEWKPIFKWIPIESIIKDNQTKYYEAISISTSQGKSDYFITFMLKIIKSAVEGMLKDSKIHYTHEYNHIAELLAVIETYPLSLQELMKRVGLKSRETFRKNYLQPALKSGLIAMTNPDVPKCRNQKYYKT